MVVAQSCCARWSRGQLEARFANMSACPIGMEACVGAQYESSTERMVIRQRIDPDAARALREFAAQVIEHDASTIVH